MPGIQLKGKNIDKKRLFCYLLITYVQCKYKESVCCRQAPLTTSLVSVILSSQRNRPRGRQKDKMSACNTILKSKEEERRQSRGHCLGPVQTRRLLLRDCNCTSYGAVQHITFTTAAPTVSGWKSPLQSPRFQSDC